MGTKKQVGLIGLYSGREIKTSASQGSALTRSQTGKQAVASIVEKYGAVVDNAKYFHKGKGVWHKYSLENDKKRTGSVTTDMTAWRQRPNKLDFQGIDTADGKKSVKKLESKKFKLPSMKLTKPVGRTTKSVPTVSQKPSVKSLKLPLSLGKKSKKSRDTKLPRVSMFTENGKHYIRLSEFADEYLDREVVKADLMGVRPSTIFYNPSNAALQSIDRVVFVEKGHPPRATIHIHSMFNHPAGWEQKEIKLENIPKIGVYKVIIPGKQESTTRSVNEFIADHKTGKKPEKDHLTDVDYKRYAEYKAAVARVEELGVIIRRGDGNGKYAHEEQSALNELQGAIKKRDKLAKQIEETKARIGTAKIPSKFKLSSMKSTSKPVGRHTKTGLRASGKPVLKTVEKPVVKPVVKKEMYQTRFIDYLKSTNCRDEFRHYVMNHEMAIHWSTTNGAGIPANVREDYIIDMKGYRIKSIKLTAKAHSEANKYYLDAQKGRTPKAQPKASHVPVMKTMEKSKVKLTEKRIPAPKQQLKSRTTKTPLDTKHVAVTKLSNVHGNAYMKNSPYTSRQIQIYNAYSFYDVDINKEFNSDVGRMEKLVNAKFPKGAPAEVLKAVANYRKATYEYYLEESRARSTAPSQMVVGPAGYKNFDRKRARADTIRKNASEKVKYADKQIDLAIKRSSIKVEVNAVKTSYDVKVGDQVILFWTNSNRKFQMPARVVTINAKTLIGELESDFPGHYPKGTRISVPMYGTKGNRWTHVGKDKPAPATNKELMDKYYAEHPSVFKVGDRVKHLVYGEGVVTKVNKQTMTLQVPPQYKGDKGIRKVSNDEKVNKKL